MLMLLAYKCICQHFCCRPVSAVLLIWIDMLNMSTVIWGVKWPAFWFDFNCWCSISRLMLRRVMGYFKYYLVVSLQSLQPKTKRNYCFLPFFFFVLDFGGACMFENINSRHDSMLQSSFKSVCSSYIFSSEPWLWLNQMMCQVLLL